MNNLKRPAYPQPLTRGSDGSVLTPWQHHEDFAGFTKLEKAALIISAGYVAATPPDNSINPESVAEFSVRIAAAVLEEANK